MNEVINSQFKRYARLAQMGALLAGEQHLPRLYDLIVSEALALTNAQMGAILMREGAELRPMATRTEMVLDSERMHAFVTGRYTLEPGSLCGQVLLEDKIFNLADIRTLPEDRPAAQNAPERVYGRFDSLERPFKRRRRGPLRHAN